MLLTKTRCWVVLKVTLNFEARKCMEWSSRVLPSISNYVINIFIFKVVNRAWREPSSSVKIPIQILSLVNIWYVLISNCKKFLLSRKLIFFVFYWAFPVAKSLSLKLVHFNRPIPRHINYARHSPKLIFQWVLWLFFLHYRVYMPIYRMSPFSGLQPGLSLLCPELRVVISCIQNKSKKLPIGDLEFGNLESFYVRLGLTHLVVEEIHVCILFVVIPFEMVRVHGDHCVLRYVCWV